MKVRLEYPQFVWNNRKVKLFDDVVLLKVSFETTLQYYKNYDKGFEQILVKLLGVGIRITRELR